MRLSNGDEVVHDLTVNLKVRHQVIRAFGAADARSIQFVGNGWPEEKRRAIAELLFSKEADASGNPKGIGLNAWRFHIGCGSAEQGEASGIDDSWRRSKCFLRADGTYDWDKQAGQLWFLKEAQRLGANIFVGTIFSPPVHFTKNGKAWASPHIPTCNLAPDKYPEFAAFLKTVVEGIAKHAGVRLTAVSPYNEPQFPWSSKGDATQEGCPYNNAEITACTKAISKRFQAGKLATKIALPEAASLPFLYERFDRFSSNSSNQLDVLFNTASPSEIASLPNVDANTVSAHSYWTTWPSDTLAFVRKVLRVKMHSLNPKLEYWMTEYCMLEHNEEIPSGWGRDLGMHTALYMARVIHADLALANASGWQWWLAVSPHDFKDGLVYIDNCETDGNYYDSKMLWVLGNYSRFIEPGMRRVELTSDVDVEEDWKGLLASAYARPGKVVVVLVNLGEKGRKVWLSGVPGRMQGLRVYQTSAAKGDNLRLVARWQAGDPAGAVSVPGRSVVTAVATYSSDLAGTMQHGFLLAALLALLLLALFTVIWANVGAGHSPVTLWSGLEVLFWPSNWPCSGTSERALHTL